MRTQCLLVCLVVLAAPAAGKAHPPSKPAQAAVGDIRRGDEIASGVQLFLDDRAIEEVDGLVRRIFPPERLPRPVLDSKTFGVTQPYLSVFYDRDHSRYRLWYNHGPAIWHAVSTDGIRWAESRVAWDLSRGYGASLVDDENRAADKARRFKLANWQATRAREDKPGDNSGMYVGFSPDGLSWTGCEKNPVLPTWPEGYGKFVRHGVGDIVDVFYDPLARRYAAAVKVHALAEDGYAPGPRAGKAFRRLVGMSTSEDFVHWSKPWRILAPDRQDEGLLEFYGMGGTHVRGSLYIGLARVLRDDLPCDPGGPKDGIGYSVLVTSRDGITWRRDRRPFLNRNLQPGSWDHAMSWIGGTMAVGEEVYFYYGGYARGHKIAPAAERQIGLARMKRDRYVAYCPAGEQGTLRTPTFTLRGDRLTINADARNGEVRVRLVDENGAPFAELGDSESKPIVGDATAADVEWPKPLAVLRGKRARLEFRVRRAALFGFEFRPAGR